MNTAEHLEAITDTGRFEHLATLVLRKTDKNYEAIIHHGINAKGQPIVHPNDGFCLIPGSDPFHFLWVQHTTTRREGLRDKWLNDNKGDLVKAWERAQILKEEFPDAKFTVILSTNQRIPDEQSKAHLLDEDVYIKANELGLTVDIWEQSRYADFLDSNRDGQWFRKEFFGTDAQMLSSDMLLKLSEKSLATYKDRQFTSPDSWIDRQLVNRISQKPEQTTVTILVGESGYGKSAVAYSFLERHIESGGFGLFIPEHIIQGSISLEDALRKTLNSLCPSLLSEEASRIPDFIPNHSQFAIVVDDINQVANPQIHILKLVNWAQPPYMVVCPLWPRFRHLVRDLEKSSAVDVIAVEQLSLAEGVMAVMTVAEKAGLEVSRLDTRSIAGRLRFDPWLIGSFGKLLEGASREQLSDLIENVVGNFIRKRLAEIAYAVSGGFFEHEYQEALSVLTAYMLQKRNIYPDWSEVKTWFHNSPEHLKRVRQLCEDRKLCRVSDAQFRFQHDRVFYYFAVNCIVEFLANISENSDVLFDPYYAEILGQALVKSPQSETVINEIRDAAPLALVSTIHHINIPSSEYQELLVQKVKEWVQYRGSSFSTPESIRGAVANNFINIDSPVVLDLVNTDFRLEVRWLGDFARFRNGDAKSVIGYCSLLNGQISGISRDENSLWEDLVDHARQHHRQQIIRDLMPMLESPDENSLKGLLVLVGFLALHELQDSLAKRWEQATNKSEILAETLWAAIRCSNDYFEDRLLYSLMNWWANPPGVDSSQLLEWQESISSRIGHALAFDASQEFVNFLIEESNQDERLRPLLADICALINSPDAIEFAVRVCAERNDEQERHRILSRWSSSSSINSPGKLPDDTVDRLQNIWQSIENSDSFREIAFQLWLHNVNHDQINVLELITPIQSTSFLFEQALWHRVLLQDESCVMDLASVLESDSGYFRVAWRLWCEEIEQVTEKYLETFADNISEDFSGGRLNDHYRVADMLRMIPQKDAERLLERYWNHLRFSRLFVQVAFFVGTSRCIELANEVLEEYPDDSNPFEHIDSSTVGFRHVTKNSPLTLEHFKNLQPHLSYFDDYMLGWYIDNCHQFGSEGREWCKNNLPETAKEFYRKKYLPTDEDLVQSLDNLPRERTSVLMWLSQFEQYDSPFNTSFPRKGMYSQNPLAILQKWINIEPTYWKFKVAAICVEEIGTREDLKILDVYLKDPWEKYQVDAIRENATFTVCRRTLE